ncbi:hypothetical protein AAE478_008679 [Parahypoxylon ruwenzoriense]
MDPFSRGSPGLTGRGPPQPSFSSFSSPFPSSSSIRPRRDPPTSHPARPSPGPHPPTPPSLPGFPILPGQQPIDPARKITPPEEKEIHTGDVQPTATNERKSPYNEAYEYYQECKALAHPLFAAAPFERRRRRRPLEDYEKPLVIKMSVGDWIELRHDLDLDSKDESYPRFSFDASTSTLIIQCVPNPIHQSITSILNEEIMMSKATVPVNLRQQTRLLFGQDFQSFRGRWSGSKKRPDLGLQVRNVNNVMELKWVLEVGFSETVKQLGNYIRLWLEGSSQVSMVTIVKFYETPSYRCPFPKDPIYNDNGEELDTLETLGIPPDTGDILGEDVVFEGEYGPATYKTLTWVGEISEIWMETWVPGADGKALQRGIAEDLIRADQIQLDFGDLLPHGYPQAITIDLGQFRSGLKDCIREMVVARCVEAVEDYKKRMATDEVTETIITRDKATDTLSSRHLVIKPVCYTNRTLSSSTNYY